MLEMTAKGYKFKLEPLHRGMNSQRSYKLYFTDKQPRLDELEEILENVDFLYQTTIELKGNGVVYYNGYID